MSSKQVNKKVLEYVNFSSDAVGGIQSSSGFCLNSMLMPFKTEVNKLEANNSLSDDEKNLLYQIVIDFNTQRQDYDIHKALTDIAGIMSRYVKKSEDCVNSSSGKIAIQPDALPFLISQVLFYIAVMCNALDTLSQKDIIKCIQDSGVSISHNFFSRMDRTPANFCRMVSYKQPELPIKYMGQKSGNLGYAIRNLVYQSGKYHTFVDIFGGSGAASLAFNKLNNGEYTYVYNELNTSINNIFSLMADKVLHKQLISELEAFQKDLKGEQIWLSNEEIDFDAEMFTYFNNSRKGKRCDNEIFIIDFKDLIEDGSYFEFTSIVNFMKHVIAVLNSNITNKIGNLEIKDTSGVSYSMEDILAKITPQNSQIEGYEQYGLFMSFYENYDLILAFVNEEPNLSIRELFVDYLSTEQDVPVDFFADKVYNKQLRFYRYYAYFANMLTNPFSETTDRVRYAIATIFIHSLVTSGWIGVSAVGKMRHEAVSKELRTQSLANTPERFLNADYKEIISGVHARIKDLNIEKMDCIDLIDKYKPELVDGKITVPTLFYSDSPYSGTSDYDDNVQGVPVFTSQSMKNLITSLRGSNSNFIFSCRAAKGANNGSKNSPELRQANRNICDNVFNEFLKQFIEQGQDLWVLAIEENKSLAELIAQNRISEIMITNFEIQDFNTTRDYKKTNFKVYTYQEFLQILMDNMNV